MFAIRSSCIQSYAFSVAVCVCVCVRVSRFFICFPFWEVMSSSAVWVGLHLGTFAFFLLLFAGVNVQACFCHYNLGTDSFTKCLFWNAFIARLCVEKR